MQNSSQILGDYYRLKPGRVSSQLLTHALCQYDRRALNKSRKQHARPSSDVEYLKNIAACTPEMDAVYARCAEADPGFGLTVEDFRAAIATAINKYLVGLGTTGETPSVEAIREFIGELQCSDLYLALACARGNEPAWQRFDREYRPFIERLTRHLAGSGTDADEVMDSVYVELFGTKAVNGVRQSKFRSYTGRGTLRGWLRAVVSNVVVDLYRERHAEVPLENWSGSSEETSGRLTESARARGSEDAMLANVVRERYRSMTVAALDQALATLDDHETLLLLYYHVDGLKLREIARIVEEPTSPVRRWFQRRAKRGTQARSSRVHESTVMRWLERAYRKVLDRFHAELGDKHGLSAAEIEICRGIATEDLGQSVSLESGRVHDRKFSKEETESQIEKAS
jgi:RNA polymerase sigma-70 factor, ECF subfamily